MAAPIVDTVEDGDDDHDESHATQHDVKTNHRNLRSRTTLTTKDVSQIASPTTASRTENGRFATNWPKIIPPAATLPASNSLSASSARCPRSKSSIAISRALVASSVPWCELQIGRFRSRESQAH